MRVEKIREKIVSVLRRHGVRKAGVFGSTARKETKSTSDVDLLVELSPAVGLLEFIALKLELEKKLNKRVDLVEYRGIKPCLRARILSEEVQIL
jgi:predicted nucleotidyltransferase